MESEGVVDAMELRAINSSVETSDEAVVE